MKRSSLPNIDICGCIGPGERGHYSHYRCRAERRPALDNAVLHLVVRCGNPRSRQYVRQTRGPPRCVWVVSGDETLAV